MIRQAYSRLAFYSSTSPAPLAFELSDFAWIGRESFDEVLFLDVADLRKGPRIRVEPVTRSVRVEEQEKEPGASRLERAYFAHWEEAPADPREEVLATKTVEEAFDLSASAVPGLRGAEAVTAYRVQAQLQGRSREYQAMFVWLAAPAPDGSCFIVLDEVTDQVAQAYREKVPLARKADLFAGEPVPPEY